MDTSYVTTVIVNWRLKEETCACLQSLDDLDFPCQVIVVDNGSKDGSVDYIRERFPEVELLELPSNLGFAAACNKVIVQAVENDRCEFIFILNNDAVVHPQALGELIRAADAHPDAGLFSPKIYYLGEDQIIWYAGARRRWGVLAAADTGRGNLDQGQFNELRQVDYIFGAGMLIRKSVFEKIGLFDEKFFLYLEDLDFCLRAQKAGFTLYFVPQAHVWHKVSASTSNDNVLRRYNMVKSTVHFLKKHASPKMVPLVLIFWALVSARLILSDLLHGDLVAIRSFWAGLVQGLNEVRAT
jgi:GT2 family glycosyltransferase